MPSAPKNLVRQQFGANAAAYATSSVHAKGASLARIVELVQPAAHWDVLDIATGAGHMAVALAPHVRSVIASDLTEEMLVQAAKLGRERGCANLTTAQADAEQLPFPDGRFDLVSCRIAPHHFPDIPAFVRESARVLKPGGLFALVDNVAPDAATTPGYDAAELAQAAEAYNLFEKMRDPSHGRAWTTAEWVRTIRETGLVLIHSEHAPKTMDFAAWCQNMQVPAATVAALRTMLHDAGGALAAFLQPTFDDDKIAFRLDELIAIARKPA